MLGDSPFGRVPAVVRIPLAVPIMSRDADFITPKDSFILNGFVEKGAGGVRVYPRPGALELTTFDGATSARSQGLAYQNGFLYAAANNNLTRIVSPTSSGTTTGGGWSNTFNGPWQGRRSHASAVFKGGLYIFGGTYDGTNILKDIWSTQDGKNWTQVVSAAPWGARAFQKTVVFNNRLYIMGGVDTAGNRLNDIWVSDDGVNWSQVSAGAAWSGRTGFGCVAFQNGIFVYGGFSTVELNDVWFSTDGSNFTQIPVATPFPACDGFGAVAFAGKLWVIGGYTGAATTNEVWSSPDGLVWTRTTAAAFADSRNAFGCTVYNGAMWVVAGNHIAGGSFLRQNVYSSTDGITWTQATASYGGNPIFGCTLEVFPAPPGVSSIGATTMYLLGGATAVPAYLNLIWWANIDGTLNTTWAIPSTTPYETLNMTPINDNQYFAMKDTKGLYVLYQNQLTKVTDVNYPNPTVPGLVNLDETLYVMTPDGLIMGSAIGDPFTWPSRNFLGADYENDAGVAIAKYQNYVVAFGVTTTQFFYNSGIPPILLRPNKNMNLKIGCAFAYSVVMYENGLAWIGRTQARGVQVFALDGGAVRIISTPWVDRILSTLGTNADIQADFWRRNGKGYLVFSVVGGGYSLVYDIDSDWWYVWNNSSLLGYFPFCFYATDGTEDYLLQRDFKRVVTIEEVSADDTGTLFPINTIIQTNREDFGSNLMKMCTRATILGDNASSNLFNDNFVLSYTDDDYQTFSTGRNIPLGGATGARMSDTRFGRFRRRAWRLSYSSLNQVMPRVEALELELGQGSG